MRGGVALLATGVAAVVAGLAIIVSCDVLLRVDGRSDLVALTLTDSPWILAVLVSTLTGVVLITRVGHRVGWLLLGIGVAIAGLGACQSYAAYGAVARPGALPAAAWVITFCNVLFPPIPAFVAVITLLTPSGRFSGRRSRALAVAVGVGVAVWSSSELLVAPRIDDVPPLPPLPNRWALEALDGLAGDVWSVIGPVIVNGGLVVAGVALLRRYRRATGVERAQLRWVAYGVAIAAVAAIGASVAATIDATVLTAAFGGVVVCAVPVTVTIAISRVRLYDLDRIISRSLLLLVLLVAVGAVYVAVVASLGWLGGASTVDAGIAAVAAAIAVAPIRSAAQRLIDRSLFGRRSEPFAVVSGLNRRLQAATSPHDALQELTDTIATDLRLPFVAVESIDGTVLAARGTIPARVERFDLLRAGGTVGSLVVGLRRGEDAFDAQEVALLEDVAAHAGAAVEATVLVRRLRSSQRRIVTAREEERRRLRRDLHDGLGPQLTAVTLKIDASRNLLRVDSHRAQDVLAGASADVRVALDDIRRLVEGLRPPGLDELGLVGALRRYAGTASPALATPHVSVTAVDIDVLPAPVEVAAYRIVTEAVTNAVRHGAATRCDVSVVLDGALIVEITDDGIGLASGWTAGVGITSMRERALQLGGTCVIEPGSVAGTTVVAVLPLTPAAP